MKISVIITSKNEPLLVGRAIKSAGKQLVGKYDYEIFVVAPDQATRVAAAKFCSEFKVTVLADPQSSRIKGKPAALNYGFNRITGDYVILTDGDVYLDKYAIKNLLKKFTDPRVGIVSGRIVPVNSRSDSIFGYWAHLLSYVGAHRHKVIKERRQQFFGASGYLYAIRREALVRLPEDSLDDAVISSLIYQKGYRIAYAKNSRVLVVFPTNFRDWCKQKVRNLVGNIKMRQDLHLETDRTVTKEAREGFLGTLKFAHNSREYCWTLTLVAARLYIWVKAYWLCNISKLSFMRTWVPVESTKR
jgi:cellulose synthase/poly-beta-1,6-N-acetylglucosamine synthase-like glycosyltransferase